MDFSYLMCVRFLHGIGLSFFTTASPAFVSDLAPGNHRGEILGHMGVASSLSSVMGPMLGITVYNIGGINYVLWCCIGLGLAGFTLTVLISEINRTLETKIKTKEYIKMLSNRSVMVASGLVLVLALMNGGIFSFLPILVKAQFDINVGLIFMIISTSLIVFRLLTSHLSDRYGRGPCAFYSFLILCLSYYLIGQSQTEWELIGAAILNGVGVGGCLPALTAFVVDKTNIRFRGIAFSIFYGAFDVGMLLGGAALGVLADITSLRDMYIIVALFGVFVVFGFALSIQVNPLKSLKLTIVVK
jgi:MFS family permease